MVKDIKTISFIDEEKQKLIQFTCRLKDNVTIEDINEFYNFLYGMKLDSYFSDQRLLKKDKLTINLIREFNKMLELENIDFSGFLSNFNSVQLANTHIVKEPVRRFMDFFEFLTEEENSLDDFEIKQIIMRHPNYIGKKEQVEATLDVNRICSNTLLFGNNSIDKMIQVSKPKEKIRIKQQLPTVVAIAG